jgi:hypothetical protein
MLRLFLVGCYFHWDWQAYWIWVSIDGSNGMNRADTPVGISIVVRGPTNISRSHGRGQQALARQVRVRQ